MARRSRVRLMASTSGSCDVLWEDREGEGCVNLRSKRGVRSVKVPVSAIEIVGPVVSADGFGVIMVGFEIGVEGDETVGETIRDSLRANE